MLFRSVRVGDVVEASCFLGAFDMLRSCNELRTAISDVGHSARDLFGGSNAETRGRGQGSGVWQRRGEARRGDARLR